MGKKSVRRAGRPSFPLKTKADGSPNERYVDLLLRDKPLAGQEWGCFSFVSPEKILKDKQLFFFEAFLKQWEMNKSMEKFYSFLNFISFKYKVNFEEVVKDYEEYIKEETELIRSSSVEDDYKTFLDRQEDTLEETFRKKHNFQTTIRGFMARGNFGSEDEARMRAKMLSEIDDRFDIFIGPVGQMIPWDPNPNKTGESIYQDEELNQLVHEKEKNEAIAKAAFDLRVQQAKEKAIKENQEKAEKYGYDLTQTLDEDGNLIDAKPSAVETKLKEECGDNNITSEDVANVLFNNENVV